VRIRVGTTVRCSACSGTACTGTRTPTVVPEGTANCTPLTDIVIEGDAGTEPEAVDEEVVADVVESVVLERCKAGGPVERTEVEEVCDEECDEECATGEHK
jgi:hypothetical protein